MDHLTPLSGVSWYNNNPFGDLLGGSSQLPPMEIGGLDVGRQATPQVHYSTSAASSQASVLNGSLQYVQEHSDLNVLEDVNAAAQQDVHPESKSAYRVRPALGEKITCELCNATFACGANLRNHLRIHTGERPYICEECGASFTQRSNLRSHKRVHTGERPYMCGICGQRFARSSHLPGHMRTHTGEKPFNCPHCGRSFATNQIMKNHMRTHTGERPFVCEVCDATFAQSSCLATHKKIHTGERNFKCSLCSKAFISRSGLQTHFRVHTGEKPYTCGKCDKSFKTSSYLSKHKQKYCGNSGYKNNAEHADADSNAKRADKKTSIRKMGKSVKAAKSASRLPKRCVSKRLRRSRRHKGNESDEEDADNTSIDGANTEVPSSLVKNEELEIDDIEVRECTNVELKGSAVLQLCSSQENEDPLDNQYKDGKFLVNGNSYEEVKHSTKDQVYQLCEEGGQIHLGEHCVSLDHASSILNEEFLDASQVPSDEDHLRSTTQVLLEGIPLQITDDHQHSFLPRSSEVTWYPNYM